LKKTICAAIILAALISNVVTYAVVQYTRTITNTAGVKSAWNVQLWKVNPPEMLTSIEWGDMDPGTTWTTNQLFSGTCMRLKNVGNSLIWVAWELDPTTPLPSGVTFSVRYGITGTQMIDLAELDFSTISIEPGLFSGNEGDPNSGKVEFKLTLDQYATPGGFSFNILLHAADTNLG
jgi:hypothetical protein